MLDDKHATEVVPGAQLQRIEISRRSLLGGGMMIAGGVAVLATAAVATRASAAETEPVKLSQAEAGYQTSPKNGQRCADCTYFKAPSSCNLVSGSISRAGWCKKFYAK